MVSPAVQRKRDEREQRRRETSRARIQRVVVVGGVLAVLVVGSMALYTSSLFEIRSVEVTGTKRLSAASVEASAAVPPGATLLRLPVGEIEGRLLANPRVGDVRFHRVFPSTLRIEVDERVPAVLVDAGASFWSVDRTGRILGEESIESTGTGLVVVRDVPGFEARAGSVSEAPGLVNALHVLEGLTPAVATLVRGVSAPSAEETVLITTGSVEIMVGQATQLAEKCALISGILAEQGNNVVFIDVRSIERPVSRGLGE